LQQCFSIGVYDRTMTTDIWLILPYDIAWDKARPYAISNEHSISTSSISNVSFDVEGLTLDIGVPRIQMKLELS
jgi:hypothetical protein